MNYVNPSRSGYYWILRHSGGEWEPAKFSVDSGRWYIIGLAGPWRDDPIEWREMVTVGK